MQCPLCNVDLLLSDRQGIEIDYCPKCRGVWLDRGELDKLIERTASSSTFPPAMENHHQEKNFKHHGDTHRKGDYKRKKSLFHEIFDF